jgi:hypothetical protein
MRKLVTSVSSFIARSSSQQSNDLPKLPATHDEMQMNNGPTALEKGKALFLPVSKKSSKPTLNKFR